jgi:hypothetical protein
MVTIDYDSHNHQIHLMQADSVALAIRVRELQNCPNWSAI